MELANVEHYGHTAGNRVMHIGNSCFWTVIAYETPFLSMGMISIYLPGLHWLQVGL